MLVVISAAFLVTCSLTLSLLIHLSSRLPLPRLSKAPRTSCLRLPALAFCLLLLAALEALPLMSPLIRLPAPLRSN